MRDLTLKGPIGAQAAHGRRPSGRDLLVLPMPEEDFSECRPCPGPTCGRAAERIEGDLQTVADASRGCTPQRFPPPVAPDDRIRYRWLVGHQLAFVVWRLLRQTLEDALCVPDADMLDRAARLYDIYTLLLLYTGSCSAERYAATVRADMAAWHPALSGEWHRDHIRLPQLVRKVRTGQTTQLSAPLTKAVKLNHAVHMGVAEKLVPDGQSLLQRAGKQAGEDPTDHERDLIDAYFQVRRRPVCWEGFVAQAVRRLAQVLCDIAHHGLHDGTSPPHLPPRFRQAGEALSAAGTDRLEELAHFLIRPHSRPILGRTPLGEAMSSTGNGSKTVTITPRLQRYLVAHTTPPTETQQSLIDRTAALGTAAEMRIPHEQATFLTLVARLTEARDILEVGTFTGYSTLALALGTRSGGRVTTCDISREWADVAQRAWEEAGVADRVDLRLGPASDTLRALPNGPSFDLAFIDADKPSYRDYWDELVPRMRPGGLLMADNVLYTGEAADPHATGNAQAIRSFNAHVQADTRVENVMLPIADGLTLARKCEA